MDREGEMYHHFGLVAAVGLEPNAPLEGGLLESKSEDGGPLTPKVEVDKECTELDVSYGQDDLSLLPTAVKKRRKRNRNKRRNKALQNEDAENELVSEAYSEQNVFISGDPQDVLEIEVATNEQFSPADLGTSHETELTEFHSSDLLNVLMLIAEANDQPAATEKIEAVTEEEPDDTLTISSEDSVRVIYLHNAEPKVSTYVAVSQTDTCMMNGEVPSTTVESSPRSISESLIQEKPKSQSQPDIPFFASIIQTPMAKPEETVEEEVEDTTESSITDNLLDDISNAFQKMQIKYPDWVSDEDIVNGNYTKDEEEEGKDGSPLTPWNFTPPDESYLAVLDDSSYPSQSIRCASAINATGVTWRGSGINTLTPFNFAEHAMEVEAHLMSLEGDINEETGLLPLDSHASLGSGTPTAPHPSFVSLGIQKFEEQDMIQTSESELSLTSPTFEFDKWKASNPQSVTEIQNILENILDIAVKRSEALLKETDPNEDEISDGTLSNNSDSMNNLLILETSGDYMSTYPQVEQDTTESMFTVSEGSMLSAVLVDEANELDEVIKVEALKWVDWTPTQSDMVIEDDADEKVGLLNSFELGDDDSDHYFDAKSFVSGETDDEFEFTTARDSSYLQHQVIYDGKIEESCGESDQTSTNSIERSCIMFDDFVYEETQEQCSGAQIEDLNDSFSLEKMTDEGGKDSASLVFEEMTDEGRVDSASLGFEEMTDEGGVDSASLVIEKMTDEGGVDSASLVFEEMTDEGRVDSASLGFEEMTDEGGVDSASLVIEKMTDEGGVDSASLVFEEMTDEGEVDSASLVLEEMTDDSACLVFEKKCDETSGDFPLLATPFPDCERIDIGNEDPCTIPEETTTTSARKQKGTVNGENGQITVVVAAEEQQVLIETDAMLAERIRKQIVTQNQQYEWPDFLTKVYNEPSVPNTSKLRGRSLGRRMTEGLRTVFPCMASPKKGLGLVARDSLECLHSTTNSSVTIPRAESVVPNTMKKTFILPRNLKLI